MCKILHARLQHYENLELSDVQAGFGKGRGTRDQVANSHWIIEKTRELQKNIYFCFIDYAKALNYVDHNKLWKALKEIGIPDYLTCLLRILYTGLEATVSTLYGTTDWLFLRKEHNRAVCCHPVCLTCTQLIMRNAGLDKLQTGIKIGGRNINNLIYVGDTSNGR